MIDFFIRKFALVISIHVSKCLAIKIFYFLENDGINKLIVLYDLTLVILKQY